MSPLIHRLNLLLLLLVCGLLAACAHRGELPSEKVRRVSFQGNSGFFSDTSDYHLRQAVEHKASPWFTLLAPDRVVALERDALHRDGWRLEVWYAHRGYLDARFIGWDIQQLRAASRRRPAVYALVGHVEEGPSSRVREVTYTGLQVGGSRVFEQYIRRNAPLQPGGTFNLEQVEETRAFIRRWMRDHSYPYATVEGRVEAWADEQVVDVTFSTELGPQCRFGEVTVTGNELVPQHLVRERIVFTPGRQFKASLLDETRRALFALGTFASVRLVQLEPVGERCAVPIEIQLAESRFQRLRTGVGVAAEGGRQGAHMILGYQHSNLARRLLRLEMQGEAGVQVVGTLADMMRLEREPAPTLDLKGELIYPGVFGPDWQAAQEISYELGVEEGYRFSSPTWQPSLTRTWRPGGAEKRLWGWLTTASVYRLTRFVYLDPDEGLFEFEGARLGLDVMEPYVLSYLEQRLVWDARDDPVFTRRGAYLSAGAGFAGGPWGGDVGAPLMGGFNFTKIHADARYYRSLARWLRTAEGLGLAGRLAAGLATPFGESARAAVPYAERFKLGGGNSTRGWITDHLGPYLCVGSDGTEYMGDCTEGRVLPTGGKLSLLTSVEARKPTVWGVGFVLFADAGMVWNGWEDIGRYGLEPSVGGGLRYASPVGPLRLDLAFRLPRDDTWRHEPGWNLHFALAEAF